MRFHIFNNAKSTSLPRKLRVPSFRCIKYQPAELLVVSDLSLEIAFFTPLSHYCYHQQMCIIKCSHYQMDKIQNCVFITNNQGMMVTLCLLQFNGKLVLYCCGVCVCVVVQLKLHIPVGSSLQTPATRKVARGRSRIARTALRNRLHRLREAQQRPR